MAKQIEKKEMPIMPTPPARRQVSGVTMSFLLLARYIAKPMKLSMEVKTDG